MQDQQRRATRRRLGPGLRALMLAAALVGCVGGGEGQQEEQVGSITGGQERLEGLLRDAMGLVRPDQAFDDEVLTTPQACDPEDPGGLVSSTLTLGWEALPLQEALEGLDAIGGSWAEQGFAIDDSRRDRPAAQELLAATPDRYELVAIVGIPNADGIVRFGVQGGTPCLEPAP